MTLYKPLAPILAIHIRYFLFFVLLKYNSAPLTIEEERTFFQTTRKTFFSLYQSTTSQAIDKVLAASFAAFFHFKKWIYPLIEQPEETSLILHPIKFVELED